jgi:hypothetical protein
LIFGSGDTADAGPPLNINPGEPLSNLTNILTGAGYGVDVDETSVLPTNLKPYKVVWYISSNPLTTSEITALVTFVRGGGGLYLTGESPCCEDLNTSDGSVVNSLVSTPIEIGGQGFADSGDAVEDVSSSAIDDASVVPNALTTWSPGQPGGMVGVDPSNVLASTAFGGQSKPTAAVWDRSNMTSGSGRLAVLMDVNWLESETWDQPSATDMAVNLEHFLTSSIPTVNATNPRWAGYAAKAQGVQGARGEWTVPTVDCSKSVKASAVRMWVGIDGFGNSDLANAGVGVVCSGPTASPCYYVFTGVHMSNETSVTGCGGVSPGDDVSVDIENQPFGSSTFMATVKVNDTVVDGQPFVLSEPSTRDASAECVVELPAGVVGPGTPARFKHLPGFSIVNFANCSATATQKAGDSIDTDQLASGNDGAFNVSELAMGKKSKPLATTTGPAFPLSGWSVNSTRV